MGSSMERCQSGSSMAERIGTVSIAAHPTSRTPARMARSFCSRAGASGQSGRVGGSTTAVSIGTEVFQPAVRAAD
jgi:hypothetical protein